MSKKRKIPKGFREVTITIHRTGKTTVLITRKPKVVK